MRLQFKCGHNFGCLLCKALETCQGEWGISITQTTSTVATSTTQTTSSLQSSAEILEPNMEIADSLQLSNLAWEKSLQDENSSQYKTARSAFEYDLLSLVCDSNENFENCNVIDVTFSVFKRTIEKSQASFSLRIFTDLSNEKLISEYNKAFESGGEDLSLVSFEDLESKQKIGLESISNIENSDLAQLSNEVILVISLTSLLSFFVLLCGIGIACRKGFGLFKCLVILTAFVFVGVTGKFSTLL